LLERTCAVEAATHDRSNDRNADVTAELSSSVFRRNAVLDDRNGDDRSLDRAIIGAQGGDPEAIRYLYTRFSDNVYGYVCSIVRDSHEAEDITQQVFMKLFRVIAKYERRGVPFSAWMLRVARNVAVDHMRQRHLVPVEEVIGSDAAGGDTMGERCRTFRDALETLSTDQREVVVLRHVAGLSPGEIAKRLGKTEGSIHGLHHRGRAALQRELTSLEAAPATRDGRRVRPRTKNLQYATDVG
jgi:RNA polymerase sigma-70 factor (ECF subfamily)